jgi:hypothetical protein
MPSVTIEMFFYQAVDNIFYKRVSIQAIFAERIDGSIKKFFNRCCHGWVTTHPLAKGAGV